jgi:hypothetical protein
VRKNIVITAMDIGGDYISSYLVISN